MLENPSSRRRRSRGFLARAAILLALVSFSAFPSPPDPAAAFEEAGRLYEQQQWTQAAEAYSRLIEQGVHSPALHMNLGNAFFKAGATGHAIFHYHQALQLAPRDPDIRANLQFARRTLPPNLRTEPSRWQRAALSVTSGELSMVAAVAWWILFALLSWRDLRPRAPVRLPLFLSVTVLLLAMAGLAHRTLLQSRPSAIVIAAPASVRFGPLADSQTSFEAPDGLEVAILDQKLDWIQIRDPAGRTGWIQSRALVRNDN